MRIKTSSELETLEIGVKISKNLSIGDLVLIEGELGAGKTRIVKGIAAGLGVKDVVVSPTFTIVNEYPFDNGILYHIDLYRLQKFPSDDIDINHMLENGIVVVEWWDKDRAFFESFERKIKVTIEIISENERYISVKR